MCHSIDVNDWTECSTSTIYQQRSGRLRFRTLCPRDTSAASSAPLANRHARIADARYAATPLANHFPRHRPRRLDTLQVNLGYKCNQSCVHCHVNAGPTRTETMSREIADEVLAYLRAARVPTLDITGGAPELNAHFRYLVSRRTRAGRSCDGSLQSDDPGAARPGRPGPSSSPRSRSRWSARCRATSKTTSIGSAATACSRPASRALRKLNAAGYAQPGTGLKLNLVYNPQGPSLPPNQAKLEPDYRRILGDEYGIAFDRLYTLANMPIERFGSTLVSKGQFAGYMRLLKDNYHARQPRRR